MARGGYSFLIPTDWQAMVTGGAEPAHKLPGVAGSNIGIKDIHKGTDGPSVLLKMDNTTAVAMSTIREVQSPQSW